MRVAMVTALFPPSVGGIQTHTLRLSQKLAARGAKVAVLTRHHAGLPAREWLDGVEVLRLGQGDAPRALATGTYLSGCLAELARRRASLDVVHAHQLLSPTSVGLAARALLGLPLIVNPHACGAIGDVAQTGRLRLEATRRLASGFVCISSPIRQELEEAGVAPERLWSVPNGVDLETFRPATPEERASLRASLGLAPEGPLVVYAGRLAPEKGPDVLLSAWARVHRAVPSARLAILGDGALLGALREAAAREGLGASVLFTGPVRDVPAWLRAADVFALPSRTEGLPVALLEGMAAGLVCVATRVGGTPEVLENGRHGRLVAPERPEALAEGLVEALTRPEARAWGTAARERVEARYSLDAVADRTLELYEQVMRRAGARAQTGQVRWG
ncbi:glycosyltransferase family 4 protein [Pyxidicoccus fallax]|uniref:glycosyltransferase family 4 protein n=1 Tax=Pyxidicoccus fallax TaxID=394095 RepID=UPI0031B5A232